VKYRRNALNRGVEQTLIDAGEGISDRYEIYSVEIEQKNYIHFLNQSVPRISLEIIV